MDPTELERILKAGESPTVEFKRCGSTPGTDTFETICSFANRNGGSIYLGVGDDGEVLGVKDGATLAVKRNIVNVVNNPTMFGSAPTIEFEDIAYQGRTIVRIWVPAIQDVYRFKGDVFDRIADADVKLRSDAQISALYLHKYNIYTEQHIFPYLEERDLRANLIELARKMAARTKPDHPWSAMTNEQLLRSANLWSKDIETGKEGYNRACALLFGTDEIISSACPAYKTDAVVRLSDTDRYDARLTVGTNLIESYDQLVGFCAKHLPDLFFLENDIRKSARNVVVRKLVSNLLIHRKFTNPFPAKLTIDGTGVRTEMPAGRFLTEG